MDCTLYNTPPEDFSSGIPVLPGSIRVTPDGPRTEGYGRAVLTWMEMAKLQGKSLSHTPC